LAAQKIVTSRHWWIAHSRLLPCVKVQSKDTYVVAALRRQIRRLHPPAAAPRDLVTREARRWRSTRVHRGHDVKVYFVITPQPWQEEQTKHNAYCGQYLPKRTDLSGSTQSKLDKIALRLNQTHEKKLWASRLKRVKFTASVRDS